MTNSTLTIGQIADRMGLAPSAVRYYERRGLLGPPPRIGGWRRYDPSVLHRLSFIKVAQEAGFTLQEVKALLEAEDEPGWRALVEAKLAELRSAITRLEQMAGLLEESLECGCEAFDTCPVIERKAAGGG